MKVPNTDNSTARPANIFSPTGSLDCGTESYCKMKDDPYKSTYVRTEKFKSKFKSMIQSEYNLIEKAASNI
jgi:hypothetical protein